MFEIKMKTKIKRRGKGEILKDKTEKVWLGLTKKIK